ncbi:serine/threonine protein kinase [Chitinivorax sp. B]|uniref:serine/threonine protein kinase n=1 Tax=Chitinivorax sp. B TaxID=2502235 RepID=UPI0010F831D2|nr:serine/threonine protein kinase [Chitinivorax sp. B]
MADVGMPAKVGRYQLIRLLGKGGQGAVYFAHDPQLQRPVAIKTIRLERQSQQATQALLDEARIVSQVQHPNIVTLYDMLEQGDKWYLVFEYVEGETLAQRLKTSKSLPPDEAVEIALQILDGLAFAHGKQIVHCDIKPANIMLDSNKVARLMDFGIARAVGDAATFPTGTAAYMAPETIAGSAQGKAADVFAMGMVLYEMLTGHPAVTGDNIFRVMHAIASEPFEPPSQLVTGISEMLDNIVMRGLLKDPTDRFASADEMRMALQQFRRPTQTEAVEGEGGGQGTLEFLLRRIRLKSDFPALSQAISAINKISNADEESLHALSAVILKDFSLTNKLLRLVNSASYGNFGGTISTISRAVIILGFEVVRNLAITLILFEHLQNRSQAVQLRDEVIRTFFSGLMARMLEQKLGSRSHEESFIGAMFQNLGRLLGTFYLFDEAMEIQRAVRQDGQVSERAEIAVLGLTYAELGMGIARAWNFPDKIIDAMAPLPGKLKVPRNGQERLRAVSGLANRLTMMATGDLPAGERGKALTGLADHFSVAVPISAGEMTRLVDETIKEFLREASLFGINANQSEPLRHARQWVGTGHDPSSSKVAVQDTLDQQFQATQNSAAEVMQVPQEQDAKAILLAGIQDITNSLVEQYNLNDLLRIILETMYRGIGFDRVMLCTRDVRTNTLPARIGFGPGVDSLLKRFIVPVAKSHDVFQVALEKQADVFLADIDADNIRDRIPEWYRNLVPAQTFILLPLAIEKKIIGLFYGDKAAANQLKIAPQELNLLKTLRNQAVLAIRQKQLG